MDAKQRVTLKRSSPYSAVLTREQFLFYETRTTARLICKGLTDDEVTQKIVSENLFQYPTERTLRKMSYACLRRVKGLNDDGLIQALATQSANVGKQICLYAMMCQYRLVAEFMVTVIGEKYRVQDLSFGRVDVSAFFLRLQEQDDWVAVWSDATMTKLKQVLVKLLVENEYLDDLKAQRLNPVLLCTILENAIAVNGDQAFYPAFNYFK